MLLLAAATGLVLAASAAFAAALRLRSFVGFVLAAYLVAGALVVGAVEALSLFRVVRPGPLLAALAVATLAAGATWLAAGRPRPPVPAAPDLAGLVRRHPLLVLLGVAVGAAVVYQAALVVALPPNNWDSMTYHLSRAAGWYQAGGVGYLEAHTERQNAFPPNAEIFVLFTFVYLAADRLAGAPQLLAELAALLAVAGIALRLGATRAQAAFAALLLATLTQIALQASTTQNDLLTASFVGAAAYFALGRDRRETALAGLAVGLAVGTKLTALFVLPALLVLVLVAHPPRRALAACGWATLGIALVGAFGFALNLAHTGSPLGRDEALGEHRAEPGLASTATTVGRMLAGFVELPATPQLPADEDLSYFGPLGALVLLPLVAAALWSWLRRRGDPRSGALALALPVFLVGVAAVYRFNPWMGRFLVVPVVLAAALAAPLYARRLLVLPVTALALVTLGSTLLFNHAKPALSVWTHDRAAVQSLQRPSMAQTLAAIERLPAGGRVGYVLGEDDWDYPLYGERLRRELRKLPADRPLERAEAERLRHVVLGAGAKVPAERSGWAVRRFASGWKILSRGQSPTISSGRTGTRVSSRPVASRSAATIAAVETTVGGSPTPLTP